MTPREGSVQWKALQGSACFHILFYELDHFRHLVYMKPHLSFGDWLVAFNIVFSKSIHFTAYDNISLLKKAE